ncbi:MAG: hypothetical protein LBB74_10535 [Chitinispirillales bacterium]|jgi:hypothetical protein|nr:hypothetical protein [Chitinispirillales bacterium]
MKTIKIFLLLAAALVLPVSTAAQTRLPVLRIDGKENPDVYLQSLDIQVEVTGRSASTRHTLVFKNRANRILEGMLTFPLPEGRAVTYYALDIDGKMREAVPVEKARGAQVFEEIERRRIDPGLLERVEGNNFRTRIYPIPAYGTRTVSIGYEEELAFEKETPRIDTPSPVSSVNTFLRYNLPMAYINPIEKFSVKATVWKGEQKPIVPEDTNGFCFDTVGENYVAAFSSENYRPARTLEFSLPAPVDIPRVLTQSVQGSRYFFASVAPDLEVRKKRWGDTLAIIWDVSLSGTRRDLRREMKMLNVIFAEKKDAIVNLYYLNNRLKKIVNKNIKTGEYNITNGNWDELKNALNAAVFDGGTDFSQIDLKNIAGNEILFFSDGISTLSDADFLKVHNINRPIHSVVSSANADYNAMRQIAGKTNGKFININALSPEKLKDGLLNETPQFLGTVHGEDVREVYPGVATPVHGNFSIAGISGTGDAELTLLFGFGGKVEKRLTVKLDAENIGSGKWIAGQTRNDDTNGNRHSGESRNLPNNVNVHKLWAQKKIAELDLNYERNSAGIAELGRQFGIVTRNTSLIVLETLDDYLLYEIPLPLELQAELQRRQDEDEHRRKESQARIEENGQRWREEDKRRKEERHARLKRHQEEAKVRENVQQAKPPRSGWWRVPRAVSEFSYMYPKKRNTKIYEWETQEPYEGPIATADPSDVLTVIKVRMYHYKVRTARGDEGYVLKNELKKITPKKALTKSMNVETAEIVGYLDNPAPSNSSSSPGSSVGGISAPAVKFKPVRKDNDYLGKLTGKTAAEGYLLYLKLRDDYADSPAFYFDMAGWFYALGDKETALRALTSIAELELENAPLYRMLGYRLKEYGEYALEKFVCRKVIEWRPLEFHGYRDYALALADNGEAQAALDTLNLLLGRYWWRSCTPVVITEMNRLIAKNANLNTSNIEKDLITDVKRFDIRVVINWNMDNTDIALHVIDPKKEECYYGHPITKLGGLIHGYGPQQFILKKAKKGKYRVYVSYRGDSRVTPDEPTTVMAEIYTKYADKGEQRRVVCLQLSKPKEKVNGKESKAKVAEFEF